MRKNNFFGILATTLFFISSCTRQNLQPSADNTLSEIKVRLELTKFRVNGQLGDVYIDYATRNVVVFVPYNHNLANTMITEIESSARTKVVYNGNTVVPNTMVDFTVPRLFLIQSEDGKTSQWTVRVTPLTIQAMTIPGMVAAPVINAAMKTITVEFQYGSPKETPVQFTLPMGASTSITEPIIDLVAPIGAFQKSTTFDLKVKEYSEQWTLITTHRVKLNEVGSMLSPNGETTGWSFTSMTHVNDQSNPAGADIIAYDDVTGTDINAAAGGLDQTQPSYPSVNKTRFVFYGDNAAAQTFFQTGTLTDAKNFFNNEVSWSSTFFLPGTMPKPSVNGYPFTNEVYILKLDNGKYILIRFPEERVNPPDGYFSFNYRLLE